MRIKANHDLNTTSKTPRRAARENSGKAQYQVYRKEEELVELRAEIAELEGHVEAHEDKLAVDAVEPQRPE